MSDQVWESCAATLARIESRLQSQPLNAPLEGTADELQHGISWIERVEIEIQGPGDRCETVARGREISHAPTHQFENEISQGEQIRLNVWAATLRDSGGGESDSAALGQTTHAVGQLLVGAVARDRLDALRSEIEALLENTSELAKGSDASIRLHRIAESIATSMDLCRVAILQRLGNRYRCVASSAQSRMDRRSARVLQLERLANSLKPVGGKVQDSSGEHQYQGWKGLSVQDSDYLPSFVAEGTDASHIVVASLEVADCLLIGETDCVSPAWPQGNLQPAVYGSAIAANLPQLPVSVMDQAQHLVASRRPKRILFAIAAMLLALLVIPARIRVSADGKLIPQSQQIVYSPLSGQIAELLCEPGTQVAAGDPLCKFASQDLELDIARLRGEVLTVQEQLQIAATRRGEEAAVDVASDRRVLEIRLRELNKQLDLQIEREQKLTVSSEIAGVVSVVLTDEVGMLTSGRPVELGQPVLRVIDANAGFNVELQIPDRAIGYVANALRQRQQGLNCDFRIRSQPEQSHQGTLTRVSPEASLSERQTLVVKADVSPAELLTQYAAESGVTGEVTCERASLGFVLTRRVIEQLRLWGWL